MSETETNLQDRIDDLFQQAQEGDEATQDMAQECLRHFRRDCRAALDWQRETGRALLEQGQEPQKIRQQAEAMIDEARKKLHARLVGLLDWAASKRASS